MPADTLGRVPLRPRTHTIEDESERRFRDAIPPQWVARRLEPDYGLDLTVEVFDDAGHSTPYSFHVQLKATDEEDVRRALRPIRFRRELAEYYWSLPIPVLVVRYHAPTGQLYARWFHAYNPLVAAHPDAEPGAEPPKTVGFVFTEQDRWAARTPAELVHGVESFRRFRSPDLPLPQPRRSGRGHLRGGIDRDHGPAHGVHARRCVLSRPPPP
jgi:hypothetical protein